MGIIKLQSNDLKEFSVEISVAKMSGTIKQMMEDLNIDEDSGDQELIPLPNIKSEVMHKVIEWCQYHKVISMSLIRPV